MQINADFGRRAVVKFAEGEWVPSPMPGVERRMLDRIGGEIARATTIVRFAPGSVFSEHTHDGGEEFLVLDGVFQDEHGDFPAGSYIRNPPTSHHTPAAAEGTTILVKLHQFDPDDRQHVRLATEAVAPVTDPAAPGVTARPLYADTHEDVRVETWASGARVARPLPGGAELFVLEGGISEGGDAFGPWDWLRLPAGSALDAVAGPDGATLWIKTGHLAELSGAA